MKALNVLSIIIVLVSQDVQGQTTVKVTSDDLPENIKVPLVNNCQVKTDGLFMQDEWKGALNLDISESFEILFLSDSEYLYIGIKYAGHYQ